MNNSRKRLTTIALLFGGPSPERGISLNSARSVCDHLESDSVRVVPIYFDYKARPYLLGREWLYSNTPSDFEFKLLLSSKPLTTAQLAKELKRVDIAFPAMHGEFGDDGQVQALLEKHGVSFVGSESKSCLACYDKGRAQKRLGELGLTTLDSLLIRSPKADPIAKFFRNTPAKQFILKPTRGGSSLGVRVVSSIGQAVKTAAELLKSYDELLLEPLVQGTEFTVVLVQNEHNEPVALLPVEVAMDYGTGEIFDYRRKYLATRQAHYFCPPRFPSLVIGRIQREAERLFREFKLRDVARFDGWILKNGDVWFSDFNPVSGMEQNSFMFIQAARLGITHRQLLRHLVNRALSRAGKELIPEEHLETRRRSPVRVLFGGDTAERQVSVLSGTNVWMKLQRSQRYIPSPYLLEGNKWVWELPYACALNHTAEDVIDSCKRALKSARRDKMLRDPVLKRLGIRPETDPGQLPRRISLKQFLTKKEFVFIALHGGFGEGGDLQRQLMRAKIPFNGPRETAAQLCMDKYETGITVENLELRGVSTAAKARIEVKYLLHADEQELRAIWSDLLESFGNEVLVKPIGDGCSAGVVALRAYADFRLYLDAVKLRAERIESGTLLGQVNPLEMPVVQPKHLLFEQFIITDEVSVERGKLWVREHSGWIEVTVGVTGKRGQMHAMAPSITVAENKVLSVEEKFQGGTGINITPPPKELISLRAQGLIRSRIAAVANAIGLEGYSRVDAFVQRRSGEVMIIEVNTLPALTPSTVIFHQALAEKKRLFPRDFIEHLIELGSSGGGRVKPLLKAKKTRRKVR